jgi:hypothetical protein
MPEAQAKHRVSEVIAFGEKLIETEDLDPVYCALVRAKLPKKQLYRLLLAYFCYYHLGASARLSEATGDDFWELMLIAARNRLCDPSEIDPDLPEGRWPRGAERRHFRGSKCVAAVEELSEDPPERFVSTLVEAVGQGETSLATVMRWIQQRPMMGPWIAFKAADLLERVLSVSIVFPNDLTLFYKEPRAALDLLDIPAEEANAKLLKHFGRFKAPPRYERFCNSQEIETIACKTKSYWGGHYHLGKDVHEIRKGLAGWGETATKLLNVMPKEIERGLFS